MDSFNVPDDMGTVVQPQQAAPTPVQNEAQPAAPSAFTVPTEMGTPVPKKYDIASTMDRIKSTANAAAIGFEHGVNTFSSTLTKAISKYTNPALQAVGVPADILESPQSAQQYYEDLNKQYQTNPDVLANPKTAIIGNIAGNLGIAGPIQAAGTLLGGVGGPGNFAAGAFLSGTANYPGNAPDNLFNWKNALTGGVINSVIPAIAGGVGSAVARRTAFISNLESQGYKGPVFDTDIPAPPGTATSLIQGLKAGIVNNITSRLPVLSSWPGFGGIADRQTQQQGVRSVINNYVGRLAEANSGGDETSFINAIKSAKQDGENAIQDASNNFRGSLSANGITHSPMPDTFVGTREILGQDYPLSKPALQALTSVNDTMPVNRVLGAIDENGNWQPGLKQQVWNEYERLDNLGKTNTDAYNASLDLRELYNTINKDISNIAPDNPNIASAFHNFNAVTTGVKSTWDPATMPLLAKAAKNIDDNEQGAVSLWNAMTGKNISPNQLAKYSDVIGPEGMGAVQAEQLQNLVVKNTDGKVLNVSGFLNDLMNQKPGSQRAIILKPAQDALGGLQQFANTISQGTAPGAGAGALAGGIATAAHFIPGAQIPALAVGGTLAALGAITARPILKSSLGLLNKIGDNTMPGTAAFIRNNAAKALSTAGIIHSIQPDGSVHFDVQPKE